VAIGVGSAPGRVEGAVSTDVSGVGPLPVFFNIGGRTSVKGTFFPIVVEGDRRRTRFKDGWDERWVGCAASTEQQW